MPNLLFPNFLKNESDYRSAEKFWAELWVKVLVATGNLRRWNSPWLNTTCVDGTRLRDGNPIFSAIREDEGRAVTIIQFASPQQEAGFWTNVCTFDPEEENIPLLEVFCSLSDEVAEQVFRALVAWVDTEPHSLDEKSEATAPLTTNG